ncbi:MAG: type III-A CRISPR-associated protein Csm2 [Acholeplasmatales bacterium]|jgi:CRISPR type III-A-associated protein Csm2|nr:type III-A CRISPR-associated protein Csm2 [Acholeplasmatales bacterium]
MSREEFNVMKKDYTQYAEKKIKALKDLNYNPAFVVPTIKTNQLRNIYALISPFFEYFNYGKEPNKEEAIKILQKAKIKIAYQIGRDNNTSKLGTKNFNKITLALDFIDVVLASTTFMEDLKIYCNYFEALVAYHKFIIEEK